MRRVLALQALLLFPLLTVSTLTAQPQTTADHAQLCHELRAVAADTVLPYLHAQWEEAGDRFQITRGAETFVIDATTGEQQPITSPDSEGQPAAMVDVASAPHPVREGLFAGMFVFEVPSPGGIWMATEKNHDVWIRSTAEDGKERQLTEGGTQDRAWSLQDDMMMAGAQWSPDGAFLAAIREERGKVFQVPTMRWLGQAETVEHKYLPRPGEAMPRTELFLIPVPDGDEEMPREDPIRIADGDGDHYLGLLTWLPDSSEFVFFRLRRDFKELTLLAANRSGKVRSLLVERQHSFIKGIATNPGLFSLFTPLPERRQFLWISERDGWDHLYLYDWNGKLLRRLTQGSWPVLQVVAVDENAGKEGWVYFTAHPPKGQGHPYDTQVYRVSLDQNTPAGYAELERLTEGQGVHQALFSPDGSFFLDLHSAHDRPPRVDLRRADGGLVKTLEEADDTPLRQRGWHPPEVVTLPAADGATTLHGILYRPFARRSEGTSQDAALLPIIDAIYGGPQTLRSRWDFVGDPFSCALAQAGFAVLLLDARGTPERGKAFQDAVFGKLGQIEIADHAAALRKLAKRPDLDGDRIGIQGGSWGGYFTLRAMVTEPDLFKVGVAINAVAEVTAPAAMGVEPYLGGGPGDVPDAYAAAGNLAPVENLKGKLLLIHGSRDTNAPIASVMKFIDALVQAGKPYDLLLLPDENHHVSPIHRRYLLDAQQRYFQEHL